MQDIGPILLKKIQEDFQKNYDKSEVISQLYAKVRDGTATYDEANDYAIEVGELLVKAYKNNLSSDVLPDGKMYYNIAKSTVDPTMRNNYNLVTQVTEQIQTSLNRSAGIGIKAVKPELNEDRIRGIIDKVSNAENFDDVEGMLDGPILNFTQSIIDDAIKVNAQFQYDLGMNPQIIRTSTGKCCEWCSRLVGTYEYEEVSNTGNDVFRRHQNCKCKVLYDPKDGKRKLQDVHTKKWKTKEEHAKIIARKYVGMKQKRKETPRELEKRVETENRQDLAGKISTHPKMLQAYTAKGLKQALEKAGYEVLPLGKGGLKGIVFEEGGGFRIHFGGDGILQYHPGKGSHHGGAYYKISTGEGGIRRYELDGTEKHDVE